MRWFLLFLLLLALIAVAASFGEQEPVGDFGDYPGRGKEYRRW